MACIMSKSPVTVVNPVHGKISMCFRFLGESRLALRDVLNSPNLAASFTISLLDTKRNNTGVSVSVKHKSWFCIPNESICID